MRFVDHMGTGFLMEIGLLMVFFVVPALAGLVLLVVALLDLVRRPAAQWEATGHSQLVWVLITLFVWLLGPMLYLIVARPALQRAGDPAVAQG